MMAKKPSDRYQTAGELAALLKDWLADRGRAIGGGQIDDGERESGLGSGVFSRYALGLPTPGPSGRSSAKGASGSSRTISVSDRDTKKLDEKGSGAGGADEEIGLAPLDDEDVLGLHRKGSQPAGKESGTTVAATPSGSDTALSSDVSLGGSSKARSLIEEELHDPELEEIKRRVQQRAKFNPLQPPGYVPPAQGVPLGVWVVIGGVLVVGMIVLALALFGPGS
jgi:hypothetical protein